MFLTRFRLRRATGRRRTAEPFHAVSISPGANACDTCRGLSEVRFLSVQAPPLPLPGCDLGCRCVYRHHADRRAPSLQSSYFAQLTGRAERRR